MRIAVLLAIALFCTSAFAQGARYLHISTNPSYADAYVETIQPNHSCNPDTKLPGFIKVPDGERNIVVAIFKEGFKDTVLNVTLPESDTSYLIVALTPSYDDEFLSDQRSALSRRARHNFGFRLMVASAVPFVTSGIAAIVASNSIDKANEKKRLVEQSLFHDNESYNHNLERYGDYRDRAKAARTLSIDMLIAGAALLGIGVVLSF